MTAEMPSWERRWWRLPLVAVSAVARPDHDQFWTDGGDDHIHSAGRCEGPYGPDGNGDICVERKSARRFIAGWLADRIVRGTGFGLFGDLLVGVVGTFVGKLAAV
jgi:hypothetical protein